MFQAMQKSWGCADEHYHEGHGRVSSMTLYATREVLKLWAHVKGVQGRLPRITNV